MDCALIQHEYTVRQLTEEVAGGRRDREPLGHPAAEQDTCPCPHCGNQVVIVGRLVQKPTLVSREALTKLRRQIAEADGHLANRENALRAGEMLVLQTRNRLIDAPAAKDRLERIPPGATSIAERVVEKQRQRDAASADLDRVRTRQEANRLRLLVEQVTIVVKQLAPALAPLCRDAGWAVAIQPDNVDHL